MRIAGEIFHAAVWGKWMDQIPPEGNIYELEKMDARRTPGGGTIRHTYNYAIIELSQS